MVMEQIFGRLDAIIKLQLLYKKVRFFRLFYVKNYIYMF